MSFFMRNKTSSSAAAKRKKKGTTSGSNSKRPSYKKSGSKKVLGSVDEEIPSESDEIDSDVEVKKQDLSSEEEEETAQEKRLRLTKEYLLQIEAEEAENEEDEDRQRDLIGDRLKQDILEQSGKLQKKVAASYVCPTEDDIHILRGHKLPITCVVISPDSKHVYSSSKDCSIIKWDISSRKKVHSIPGGRKGTENQHIGHTDHILAMDISSDGKFLASGDKNKLIHIWEPETLTLIHTFKGHRDAISGLSFRKGTHQLFSASCDRSVKIWSLDEMGYIETLFGHQDSITAIDSLSRDRAITAGGRDCSIRLWKVVEESQLVFHGHSGSLDCVALCNEEHFVSGADDNSISLWSIMKKKPLVTIKDAHCGTSTDVKTATPHENWITCVSSLPSTDLIASGSKDGCIRLWQAGEGFRSLTPLFNIPVLGFVNSLQFSHDGTLLIAGIGQEHRLGRWWRIKEAKNSVVIIKLKTDIAKNKTGTDVMQ